MLLFDFFRRNRSRRQPACDFQPTEDAPLPPHAPETAPTEKTTEARPGSALLRLLRRLASFFCR